MKTIKVKINGIEAEAADRTPILNIAEKLGIKIPTLCHHPILEPYGVCRVCTVEVRSGKRVRMVTACNYPATNGIEVLTDSERVRRDRKLIIEWLMSRCGHVPVIEQLAAEYGITEPRFGRGDDDCILCGLCVRVCSDVVGANVLGFFNRGTTREVSTAYGETSDKCIACGACAHVCPTGAIRIEDDAALVQKELPMGPLTPIGIPFMQAVPHQPVIDRDSCIHFKTGACKVCEKVCEVKAIDHSQQDRVEELEVGAVVLATGFQTFDARKIPEYGYGRFDNVLTGMEFEKMNSASGSTGGRILMADGKAPKSVGIIHCVGSRDQRHNKHCSRVCCMYALKFAHLIKEKTEAEVYNFYIDMRCFGKGYEEFYHRLLEEGVRFIRGRAASVTDFPLNEHERGKLIIRVEDTLLGQVRRIPVDMVVLATGLEAAEGAAELARTFHISCQRRFLHRAAPEARPGVDGHGRDLHRRRVPGAEGHPRHGRTGLRGGVAGAGADGQGGDRGRVRHEHRGCREVRRVQDLQHPLLALGHQLRRGEARVGDQRRALQRVRHLRCGMPERCHHRAALHRRAAVRRNRRSSV